jgi:6-phosphogluconolactonase
MQTVNALHCYANPTEVASAVATAIMASATAAIAARGAFKIVLAGGNTPAQVYRLLIDQPTDWSKWHVYYGDERCVPPDDPQRNSVMAQDAWLNHVTIPSKQIHAIPAELAPTTAAADYAASVALALPFDLVLLGMGEDGHTASLFPGHTPPAASWVHAVEHAPKPPADRITLSAAALSQTQQVLFLITGANKQDALREWYAGHPLPVSQIAPQAGIDVYLDTAALGLT